MNEINLTPNYDNMFATFSREANIQVEALISSLHAEDHELETLRTLHGILHPVAILAQCTTNLTKVVDLRAVLQQLADTVGTALQTVAARPPKCDQCEQLRINGVVCHETGCPNAKKTWNPEREAWVKYVPCRNCGDDVEVGESCTCMETHAEDDDE